MTCLEDFGDKLKPKDFFSSIFFFSVALQFVAWDI